MSSLVTLRRLALALTLVLTAAVAVRAEEKKEEKEEKVPLDKVPKAVLDAVKAKFPDGKITGAEKEVEDGKPAYEIALKVKDQNVEVTLTPEGKILTIEKEIAAKDLPKAVAEALEKKYPKATIKKVEEILKGGEKVTAYEALIVTAEKKTLEVSFDPEGKLLEEEAKKDEKK